MPVYSQLVIGAPGSGKSSYCAAVCELLKEHNRDATLVNWDPAADFIPYTPDIDVRDLVTIEDVCSYYNCGPNGGLLNCFDFLERNLQWLMDRIPEKQTSGPYLIVDCPGQIELYLSCESIGRILQHLQKKFDWRIVVVHLVDSNQCLEPSSFIASCMVSLSLLMSLDLPFQHVLSKVDLLIDTEANVEQGELDLEDLCSVENLKRLLSNTAKDSKCGSLYAAICDLIEDFSLVQFEPISTKDPLLLARFTANVDHACGYILH
eukprot:jgi/Galph1/830/GphlegSOOS_G5537.1